MSGDRRGERVDRMSARGFFSGFLMGLGALTMVTSSRFVAPKTCDDGIASDWLAVGNDLKVAQARFDDFRAN